MRGTLPAYLILLNLITLIVFGKKHKFEDLHYVI
jgi:hypothetical protein